MTPTSLKCPYFSHYLRSGFLIDMMACLPYDALNALSPNSSFYTNIFSILKVIFGQFICVKNYLKVMRLFRLGRVARSIQRFLESSFHLLILMMGFYLIVCHWFACAWCEKNGLIALRSENLQHFYRFVIGKMDLDAGRYYGWMSNLANKTGKEFTIYVNENGTKQVREKRV